MNVIWLMSSLFIFFNKTKPKIVIAQQSGYQNIPFALFT